MTAKEIIAGLPERFDASVAPGLSAVVQFELTGDGDDGGRYHLIIKDGAMSVVPGMHRSPSLGIRMAGRDYVEVATGKLSRQKAFLENRLRIVGDAALAVKLQSMIGLR